MFLAIYYIYIAIYYMYVTIYYIYIPMYILYVRAPIYAVSMLDFKTEALMTPARLRSFYGMVKTRSDHGANPKPPQHSTKLSPAGKPH